MWKNKVYGKLTMTHSFPFCTTQLYYIKNNINKRKMYKPQNKCMTGVTKSDYVIHTITYIVQKQAQDRTVNSSKA